MEKIKEVGIVNASMLHTENSLLRIPVGECFQKPQGGLNARDGVRSAGLEHYLFAVINSPVQSRLSNIDTNKIANVHDALYFRVAESLLVLCSIPC